jgi:hypothetical protein
VSCRRMNLTGVCERAAEGTGACLVAMTQGRTAGHEAQWKRVVAPSLHTCTHHSLPGRLRLSTRCACPLLSDTCELGLACGKRRLSVAVVRAAVRCGVATCRRDLELVKRCGSEAAQAHTQACLVDSTLRALSSPAARCPHTAPLIVTHSVPLPSATSSTASSPACAIIWRMFRSPGAPCATPTSPVAGAGVAGVEPDGVADVPAAATAADADSVKLDQVGNPALTAVPAAREVVNWSSKRGASSGETIAR